MKTLLTMVVVLLIFYLGGYAFRYQDQKMLEERADNLGVKQCYTNQDIELIVFGQIQE